MARVETEKPAGSLTGELPGRILLTWTAHPLARRPLQGALAAGIIVAVALGAGWLTRSGFWGAFSAVVLFLSLESFFLPTTYEVGEGGLLSRKAFSRTAMDWGRFRRVYEDGHGLTLSPYRRKAFLEPYRAARILYDGGERDAIRSAVRGRLAEGIEWLDLGKKAPGG